MIDIAPILLLPTEGDVEAGKVLVLFWMLPIEPYLILTAIIPLF
jgi:hypothetical protein